MDETASPILASSISAPRGRKEIRQDSNARWPLVRKAATFIIRKRARNPAGSLGRRRCYLPSPWRGNFRVCSAAADFAD